MMENKENDSPNPDVQSNETDDLSLDTSSVNLQDEIESEEEELSPPEEENEAKEVNVGTILGAIFIGIAVILIIVMLAGGKKGGKKNVQKELDKAGSKYEVDFKEKNPKADVIEETFEKEDEKSPSDDNKEVDDILNSLPNSLQHQSPPSQAPVAPVGSNGYSSSKSTRPDTRNSRSPRKIDGLKGQASPDANHNIVGAVMNGNYNPLASNQKMTKEEYIAQMMKQTQNLQNGLYGAGSIGAESTNNQAAAFQQNKEQFYANGNGSGGNGQFLSYNSIWDGTIISGALVTAVNTDNPGVVIARVTENVYSSYDHSFLLIPEGSTLYATYNSSVSYGQNRVQVAWNLLIRPDGYRIALGNMNGVNAQGESGYKGRVNNHPWETLKALGMIAIYSMIQTEAVNDINTTQNEYLKNAMTDVYSQTTKIGNKIIDRSLDIKPTITIKAGTEIKLITNTVLELPPVQVNQATKKYIRTR